MRGEGGRGGGISSERKREGAEQGCIEAPWAGEKRKKNSVVCSTTESEKAAHAALTAVPLKCPTLDQVADYSVAK